MADLIDYLTFTAIILIVLAALAFLEQITRGRF